MKLYNEIIFEDDYKGVKLKIVKRGNEFEKFYCGYFEVLKDRTPLNVEQIGPEEITFNGEIFGSKYIGFDTNHAYNKHYKPFDVYTALTKMIDSYLGALEMIEIINLLKKLDEIDAMEVQYEY